jgi:hypothetical protein
MVTKIRYWSRKYDNGHENTILVNYRVTSYTIVLLLLMKAHL